MGQAPQSCVLVAFLAPFNVFCTCSHVDQSNAACFTLVCCNYIGTDVYFQESWHKVCTIPATSKLSHHICHVYSI